ncbi:MAG: hypothetical protein ABSF34_18420 [Verrucomicrobiota bacterium]
MNNKVIARARPVHIMVAGRILRQKLAELAMKNSSQRAMAIRRRGSGVVPDNDPLNLDSCLSRAALQGFFDVPVKAVIRNFRITESSRNSVLAIAHFIASFFGSL